MPPSKKASAKKRREKALDRLKIQAKSGQKPLSTAIKGPRVLQDLSEKDKKRMAREMAVLEERI